MTHDPSEPSRLLKDLESIRILLDEQPDATASVERPLPHADIPLLQDVISEQLPMAEAPAAAPELAPPTPDRPHNPFLPYDSLARLAEERLQLDRLMAGHIPPPRDSVHTGAREVRLEARLQAEVQLVLQDVIDDMIPAIEAELRNRLRGKLEEIVRQQLK
ncbi:MAG TPA: hypothetical protein ENI17_16455 [Pseudomonas xinjiangensis]|uniref:DNA polymerase III subunit chi n=2 Tax=root TaxID=1 RepID=A0A7V1FRI8_9GAMM|nr:hypothetical protein [Halopseudomonas xinjiangensis]HEC49195.1 hypothetical protein [Halopseudomonas xinjiangensis]